LAAVLFGAAACDPIATTDLRNGADRTVVLRSVSVAHAASVEREGDAEVQPDHSVRFLHGPARLSLSTAGCDLAYDLPAQDLSNSLGAANGLEVGPDLRIYLRRQQRPDGTYARFFGAAQPAGWPVAPSSRTCR
jgi:hypothetical protein